LSASHGDAEYFVTYSGNPQEEIEKIHHGGGISNCSNEKTNKGWGEKQKCDGAPYIYSPEQWQITGRLLTFSGAQTKTAWRIEKIENRLENDSRHEVTSIVQASLRLFVI